MAGSSSSFTTQIDKIVVNTKEKMLAVMRDSLQETVEKMQTPVAKGGKMRVDTGFLRASGAASLQGFPSGLSENPGKVPFTYNGGSLISALASMKMGDNFYWGWTAKYAKYREAYDGFMESALQNWQNQVNSSVEKVRKMFA